MKIPRLKYRMNKQIVTIGKHKLVEIMRELQPDKSKKSREEAYDSVTAALNGVLNAYARDLPRGTHLRVRLNDCFSINLCWMVGKAGEFAPYPNIWISAGGRLRARIHAQRAAAYKKWKADLLRSPARRTVQPHAAEPEREEMPLTRGQSSILDTLMDACGYDGGQAIAPAIAYSTGQGEEKQLETVAEKMQSALDHMGQIHRQAIAHDLFGDAEDRSLRYEREALEMRAKALERIK